MRSCNSFHHRSIYKEFFVYRSLALYFDSLQEYFSIVIYSGIARGGNPPKPQNKSCENLKFGGVKSFLRMHLSTPLKMNLYMPLVIHILWQNIGLKSWLYCMSDHKYGYCSQLAHLGEDQHFM